MSWAQNIIEKFGLEPNSYCHFNLFDYVADGEQEERAVQEILDKGERYNRRLKELFSSRTISQTSINLPPQIPFNMFAFVEVILNTLVQFEPNYRIINLILDNGQIIFDLAGISDETQVEIEILESNLYDKHLIP